MTLISMQISCPKCRTTADSNPIRTTVGGRKPLPVGQCLCGQTKIILEKRP